ncbi:MAG: diguanylate cyclase [Chitinivibrionales bacterium]|nr:diguanylate cyclase [Chitinivibrionales bacterium]
MLSAPISRKEQGHTNYFHCCFISLTPKILRVDMNAIQAVKKTSEYEVLIVDDEKTLCEFLEEAFSDTYRITTCCTGHEALKRIEEKDYDICIFDLKLPDISGIELLKFAKEKDEHTEVIVITGYASLDSATMATNLGASSYLMKPLSLDDLTRQVERSVANRAFHLKSMMLMEQSAAMSPDVQGHIQNITSLFQFSRKLLLSLELPDLMEIILQDIHHRMNTDFCVIGVDFLNFSEIYAMPRTAPLDKSEAEKLILSRWNDAFSMIDKSKFEKSEINFTLFNAKDEKSDTRIGNKWTSVSMGVKGKTIGSLLLMGKEIKQNTEDYQFLYVYTSLIASIVEHAYMDMHAQLQAKTDSLTGIANYRLFHESLIREIARADRRSTSFSLLFIDIDNFKMVNDTFGHLEGNEVLKDLTRRITSVIRCGDLFARYGGEEFAIILPDTDLEGAETFAERIRTKIASAPCKARQNSISYTISIGISVYDGSHPRGKDLLIADADRALYKSKKKGKNRVSTN